MYPYFCSQFSKGRKECTETEPESCYQHLHEWYGWNNANTLFWQLGFTHWYVGAIGELRRRNWYTCYKPHMHTQMRLEAQVRTQTFSQIFESERLAGVVYTSMRFN